MDKLTTEEGDTVQFKSAFEQQGTFQQMASVEPTEASKNQEEQPENTQKQSEETSEHFKVQPEVQPEELPEVQPENQPEVQPEQLEEQPEKQPEVKPDVQPEQPEEILSKEDLVECVDGYKPERYTSRCKT
ncbi:protein TsetseEP-like [Mytilus californianus]|uniref:protein TsetseEP-like n=1 Tax=Mytilus californianus TaxID=6549 RepID=UPI002246737D|nr:protein TsetseEP-like [Mytilus californianus]